MDRDTCNPSESNCQHLRSEHTPTKCGCRVELVWADAGEARTEYDVRHCPLHAAAHALLEAAKMGHAALCGCSTGSPELCGAPTIFAALRAAEGKD